MIIRLVSSACLNSKRTPRLVQGAGPSSNNIWAVFIACKSLISISSYRRLAFGSSGFIPSWRAKSGGDSTRNPSCRNFLACCSNMGTLWSGWPDIGPDRYTVIPAGAGAWLFHACTEVHGVVTAFRSPTTRWSFVRKCRLELPT